MRKNFNKTTATLTAALVLAGTIHAQTLETLVGSIASTGRYERVASVMGLSEIALKHAWGQGNHFHVQVSGVFQSQGGGSAVVALPIMREDGDSLMIVFDGAAGALKLLAGGADADIPATPPTAPRELVFRLRIYSPEKNFSHAVLETLRNKEWVVADKMTLPLPRLRAWLEEENGAVLAGVANAELTGLDVSTRRFGTLLIIANAVRGVLSWMV